MKSFREKFDRGHSSRWTEKLQNNLKEYFVNVGCIELGLVRKQRRDFLKRDGKSEFLNLRLSFSRKRFAVCLVFVLQSQNV
jgi:hypothetical protein